MMLLECPKCQSKLKHAQGIGKFCPNRDCDIIDNIIDDAKFTIVNKVDITRESVVKECIDVILGDDRHHNEYFAQLLREHFRI